MTDQPKTVDIPRGSRDESLRRLKVEEANAGTNMSTFADRGEVNISLYYAGIRDGLRRAIQLLEGE